MAYYELNNILLKISLVYRDFFAYTREYWNLDRDFELTKKIVDAARFLGKAIQHQEDGPEFR